MPTMHEERTASLHSLGFWTYGEYLRSPMWRTISRNILIKHRFKCRCCGGRANQVHHQSYDYDTMRGARPDKLTPLCDPCHVAAEYDAARKVETAEANKRLKTHAVDGAPRTQDLDKDPLPAWYRKRMEKKRLRREERYRRQ